MKKRILAVILCIVLIAASAIMLWSCSDKNTLGKGATSFKIEITNEKGEVKKYTIKTDSETVGDALIDVKLIPEDSKAAGYFETLDGVKADYAADGSYWGFYVDGKMYMDGGVFDVKVEKGATFEFKYEKWVD